jgi:hypothetical protein
MGVFTHTLAPHTLAHVGICSFNKELFSIIDTKPTAVTCSDTLTDNVVFNASKYGLFDLSYLFNTGCGIEGISQFESVHRADYFYFQ